MRQLGGLVRLVDLLQAAVVAELFEVDMVGKDAATAQVLNNTGVGQRVQVSAYDDGYTRGQVDGVAIGVEVRAELTIGLLNNLLDFICEHECLD